MRYDLPIDEDFLLKFLNDTLEPMNESWLETKLTWITDSKFRIQQKVDSFIGKQVNKPTKFVFNESLKFMRYKPDIGIIEDVRWIKKTIAYSPDPVNKGMLEHWATADEVLRTRMDDCDATNATVGILAVLSGIPWYHIWYAIGEVYNPNMWNNKEGHFWIMYFSSHTGKWYSIDATYKVDLTPIADRVPYSPNPKRYIKINYLWNHKKVYKNA